MNQYMHSEYDVQHFVHNQKQEKQNSILLRVRGKADIRKPCE